MICTCEVCGTEFNVRPSKVQLGKGRFCTKKCFDSFQTGKEMKKRSTNYIPCLKCGIPFYKNPSQGNNQKYCSIKCRGKRVYVTSEETKKKLRDANIMAGRIPPSPKGRKFTIEHRRKIARSGPLSVHWRGGITSENKKARDSMEYREWRRKVFERDGYRCTECDSGNTNGERTHLQADHIKSFSLYPGLRYEISNGRTLCVTCHKKTPTYLNRWQIEKLQSEKT